MCVNINSICKPHFKISITSLCISVEIWLTTFIRSCHLSNRFFSLIFEVKCIIDINYRAMLA